MGGNRLPIVLLVAIVLVAVPLEVNTELTPPYFNLAEGRKITASSTCGVDTDGPELYCKLVGAHTENDQQFHSLIQGQVIPLTTHIVRSKVIRLRAKDIKKVLFHFE